MKMTPASILEKCRLRLHSDESGAVMLLLLAAFLILFMVALTLYDAGQAAQDKMDAQISADASAFTHSVVKSRSMNMIVYANIIKRMYFSFAVSYVNGLIALLAVLAAHLYLCLKWCGPVPCPRIASCKELIQHFLMYTTEIAEATIDLKTLSISPIGFGANETKPDLVALEQYQQYMFQITPWWAWAENVTRAMNNGAMVTASWPPPQGNILDKVKTFATGALGAIDWGFGTDFLGLLPSVSNAVDVLPVTRRDRQVAWKTEFGPFNFDLNYNRILAQTEYCASWVGSMEWFVNTTQTFVKSDDFEWFKALFLFFQTAGGAAGCLITSGVWGTSIGNSVGSNAAYLDWKINTPVAGPDQMTPESWLQATGNLTYSYVPRSGRNSDTGERQKYKYMTQEANVSPLYKNEGYFSMAKSEIVYKPAHFTDFTFLSAVGSIPLLGSRLGLQDEPDMWSPRWTARLRPVMLPGETLQSSTHGGPAGLDTVVADTVPYLLMGAVIGGLLDSNFSVQSGLQDLSYLWRASRTFGSTPTKGISK